MHGDWEQEPIFWVANRTNREHVAAAEKKENGAVMIIDTSNHRKMVGIVSLGPPYGPPRRQTSPGLPCFNKASI
jgi:hypothetical protein